MMLQLGLGLLRDWTQCSDGNYNADWDASEAAMGKFWFAGRYAKPMPGSIMSATKHIVISPIYVFSDQLAYFFRHIFAQESACRVGLT